MIIKMLKRAYSSPDDYAVRTPINELICKVAHFTGGYYLYNKVGDQIAQIMLESNTAYLSLPSAVPSFPGATKLVYCAPGEFVFAPMDIARGDEQLSASLKSNKTKEDYSLRGDPAGYSYDIYNGNKVYANVVPSSTEKDYYLIRTDNEANVLKMIMISLALDYFSTALAPKN